MPKIELIEYDYFEESYDSCKGDYSRQVSSRGLLFKDSDNNPVAMAILRGYGDIKIIGIKEQDGTLKEVTLTKEYKPFGTRPLPFKEYRIISTNDISEKNINALLSVITLLPNIEDLKKEFLKFIREQSEDFPFRI